MAETGMGPWKLVPVKGSSSQPARVSFYIYKLKSRVSSPIYGASAVRVFVLLFLFSIFSDRRSLKIENENDSMIT